ncbi:MAG: WbqC family protein [Rhizomicrobium sp.]
MIISIHQPAYLPWLGFFDRIAGSDVFIVLDNVQFERNSFINRNRIKTPDGPIWLTVPVRLDAHFDTIRRRLCASELPVSGRKSDLLLRLCSQVGATFEALAKPLFLRAQTRIRGRTIGIKMQNLLCHDFMHPVYPQLYGEFIPAMGIVDYWMNCGDPGLSRGRK